MLMCEAEVDGSLRTPSRTSVIGKMEAKDVSFVSSGLPSPIHGCRLKLRFSGKKAFIHLLKMRVGQSRIRIKGYFRGWDGVKGELMAHSGYLDLSDFIADGAGPDSKKKKESGPSRFMERSDMRLKLKVLKGRWKTLKYGPLEAKCVFRSGNFYIERSNVQMEHGVLKVKGHVKGRKEPERLFSIYINMNNQPVKEFLHCLGYEEEYLDGSMTMEGVVFMKGREKKDLISSLTGSANVLVEKGKMKKSHVILKVLDFLSLQKIFKKRPPDLSKEEFYFETIVGHVTINKGVLETNNLVMKSTVFNAAVKGGVDLTKEWVDFDLGAEPLGTIDSVVAKIPTVAYILTGEKKSVLIYYFKVKGPLSKPKVQYVSLKNLKKGVTGFLKNLFLTPGRLFEKMSKVTEDLVKKGIPLPEGGLE